MKNSNELLNYVKNYKNIEPVEYEKYINKSKSSDSTVHNDMLLKGGMNLSGYTFEFNLNYFLQMLSNLIELPNLVISISPEYRQASFKELDLAFFNQNSLINENNNDNCSLLRTNCHYILLNDMINSEKEDFKIYDNSLRLGEIKSKFPKLIFNDAKKSKKQSLESTINSLFDKLEFYYKLYNNLKLFKVNEINTVQLIFFMIKFK